ncbi:helicase RepA family protein [Pseudomonadales bacterium]|nr:helicase RepA family protein [Pseudomonadales bacterium]
MKIDIEEECRKELEELTAIDKVEDSEVIHNTGASKTGVDEASTLDKLKEIAINDKLDAMRELSRDATFVAGRLALRGQSTVFYAAPNTGKTAIALKLLSEGIANRTVGSNAFYFNLDDTYDGLITKGDIANRHGFYVISPNELPKPNENFEQLVDLLVTEGTAHETVLLLDTIKKFTDPMDKKSSSQFMNICRKFTANGGTVVALAHTNKNKDDSSNSIPAGTSDILDDCDCAYVMDIVQEEKTAEGTKRFVEFNHRKTRGPVVLTALYSYTRYDDADYERMFDSIKLEDPDEVDELRAKTALQFELDKDKPLITEISKILRAEVELLQKDIVAKLTDQGDFSRRSITACLKRWSCPASEGGAWRIRQGVNNGNIYSLI